MAGKALYVLAGYDDRTEKTEKTRRMEMPDAAGKIQKTGMRTVTGKTKGRQDRNGMKNGAAGMNVPQTNRQTGLQMQLRNAAGNRPESGPDAAGDAADTGTDRGKRSRVSDRSAKW